MAAEVIADPAPCFHCGLPIPAGLHLHADVRGEARPMCCIGCAAVAEMLEAQGLSDWYLRRDRPTGNPAALPNQVLDDVAFLGSEALEEEFVSGLDSDLAETSLLVEGLTCPACVWVIERTLGSLEGVSSVRVSLSTHRTKVEWDPRRLRLRDLIERLAEVGFAARPDRPGAGAELEKKENRSALIRLGVAGLGAMNVMTYAVSLYAGEFEGMARGSEALMRWMGFLVATPVVLISARPFFEAALRDLRIGRPGMDVPVSLAIGGAYLVSAFATIKGVGDVYFDSVCMFTFFLSVGRYLELRVRHRSASFMRSMIDAVPAMARRYSDGAEVVVPARALAVGDRFRVRAGESIAADGIVVEGRSAVDEALLTGEPWPRPAEVGGSVVAGSINVESPLLVEATRVGEETTLASIVSLVERAQTDRPPIARMADRVSTIFVSSVLAIALLNWIGWQFVAPERALWTTLAVLVATCPCALGLATPTALAAATQGLAQAGLLITSGRVLEGLATADRFVFDKTGTLTRGQPALVRIEPLRGQDAARVMAIAGALERDSEHPLARAFERETTAGIVPPLVASALSTLPGAGVEGNVEGVRYRIGRSEWAFEGQGVGACPKEDGAAMLVWVLLADEQGPLAWFGLDDPLREDAQASLDGLANRGLVLEMLSGDPSPAAPERAERLGLEVACLAASPEGKVERIRALQAAGESVVVVGDGVNDGPSLRAGDVSIAMGSGCDLSRLNADAVLMRDELSLLPRAVDWARHARRIIGQNFGWAVAYNVLVLPLAVTGQLPPWLAAIGMSTSSLVVVLNALRLKQAPESA